MMNKYKNLLLLSTIPLSQLHVIFREVDCKVDMFLFYDKPKWLTFCVLMITVYVRMFILGYISLKPQNTDKRLIRFIMILTALDLVHFFLNYGQDFEGLKIIAGVGITYLLGKKYKW